MNLIICSIISFFTVSIFFGIVFKYIDQKTGGNKLRHPFLKIN